VVGGWCLGRMLFDLDMREDGGDVIAGRARRGKPKW